jgi:hypothetical protein
LHGLGDLACRLHRGDAIAEVFETGHYTASNPKSVIPAKAGIQTSGFSAR